MSGPLPGILAPLTIPASWAYRAAVACHNRRYDRPGEVVTIDRPVISVGNITAGGVGKTPMVAHLADLLLEAGRRPVIAMRGYGADARGGEVSDEQAEYADRLPEVPVLADPKRAEALRRFLPEHPAVDCVLLDDGFQHRQLHRDLDLVLVDGSRRLGAERLLPAGFLREPLENLSRADAVVITHADRPDDTLARAVERYHGRPPRAWSRHVWDGLTVIDGGHPEGRPEEQGWLKDRRIATLLGVGKPQSVRRQLRESGAKTVVQIPARDHERYDLPKLAMARGLCEAVEAMVMTGKDWAKARQLIDLADWPVPIIVPRLRIEVFDGADDLRALVLRAVGATVTS